MNMHDCVAIMGKRRWRRQQHLLALLGVVLLAATSIQAQDSGISSESIRLGGVMDLEGDSRGLGQFMARGLQAAFEGERVKGRSIEFVVFNDYYNPQNTIKATKELLDLGVFAMIGNVGTPTAQVSLPLLAQKRVPAVGFVTGADLLRPGEGDIVNYRASYRQETAAVIEIALKAGIDTRQICAYVQNDSYGMAGVAGIKAALSARQDNESIISILDQIITMEGSNPERNKLGPVGVYQRNTLATREGYESIKNWELITGKPCRLVVTVGTYEPIANFAGYAHYKGEKWIISAVSFTGAENFRESLGQLGVPDKIVMTQVVPALDSSLEIVAKARAALGDQLNYVSMEGYIVGRMFLKIMEAADGLWRTDFLNAVRGQLYDLDGLELDFRDDNQASDLVLLTYLDGGRFSVIDTEALLEIMQR